MKERTVSLPKWTLLILVVITMLVYTACGDPASSTNTSKSVEVENVYGAVGVAEDGEFGGNSPKTPDVVDSGRKLIKNVEMDIETKEYDALNNALHTKLAEVKGYVQSAVHYGVNYDSTDRRSNRIVVRVPSESLNEFVTAISGMGNVVKKTENVEDVTLSYIDVESRKKVLLTEQERLIALLERADSLENIIVLEQRLSEVRQQIESYEQQLRSLDNRVSYSTVTMDITEVEIMTSVQPKNVWERMSSGFMQNLSRVSDGLVDLAVLFVAYLPFILLVGVFLGGITFAIIKILKVAGNASKAGNVTGGNFVQQSAQQPAQQVGQYAPMARSNNQQDKNKNAD